jgi:hypothetical protein
MAKMIENIDSENERIKEIVKELYIYRGIENLFNVCDRYGCYLSTRSLKISRIYPKELFEKELEEYFNKKITKDYGELTYSEQISNDFLFCIEQFLESTHYKEKRIKPLLGVWFNEFSKRINKIKKICATENLKSGKEITN